jgi:hypothetical protein
VVIDEVMKPSLRCFGCLAMMLAIAVCVMPAAARADENPHLATAREALAGLKYEQAQHALEKALYSGKNGPEDMKTIYRMLGEIHAALGRADQAEIDFRILLALDPATDLGRGVSPKIQQPFQAAKTHMSSRGGLAVSCKADDEAAAVALEVKSDPLDLVAGARVIYRLEGGREQIIEAGGSGSQTLRVPASGRVTLICAALDEHGNRLVEIGSWSEPLALTPVEKQETPAIVAPAPSVRREAPAPPLYGRWYLWGTAAVLAAGGGGYFAWQVTQDQTELDRLNENSADYSFSEAEEIERRGKRNALIANISFGAAGAFAIATVLSLALAPDAPAGESSTALAPLALPRGAGVSVAFTF